MKRYCLFIVVVALLLSGCARKEAPDFALLQPEMGVAMTHPDKMEEDSQGQTLINFPGVLPSRYFVETQDISLRGVWPVIFVSLNDAKAPVKKGFCYTVPEYSLDKNIFGIVPIDCSVLGKRNEFDKKQYSALLPNRDGGVWMASPIGVVAGRVELIDEEYYDWEKFDGTSEESALYRQEIARQIGFTLSEIDEIWAQRINNPDFELTKSAVVEIPIESGNQLWEDYRARMFSAMGMSDVTIMPNGDKTLTWMSEEEMRQLLAHNPGLTPWQRFLRRLNIPLGPPIAMGIGLGSSVLNGGIAALMDSTWDTCTARGVCKRRDLSEQIAYLVNLFQKEKMKNITGE